MSTALRACVPISYPVGESLALVRERGGKRGFSEQEWDQLEIRHCGVGDRCDDLPEESRGWMLEQGIVEETDGGIEEMAAQDIARLAASADAATLEQIETAEQARGSERITVTRAVAKRREELEGND